MVKKPYATFKNHVMFDHKADAEAYCRGTRQPEDRVFRWGMGWAAPRISKVEDRASAEEEPNT